ncbi:serine/threonine protein kinase [Mycobacterium sp. 852002-50816_SCH5313054-b]|uniref:AAA family ATPase n=1 Tax=Mycobacterium sp. 852002-50816_SCH5313054-b TaxID=1834092 RepID=UPI0007FC8395|nr:AAA family ATPase [Mycobacterium sp. 852002-50816_SCH5313054-b]OBF62046.1 serine/threonine protein kinase [Mycobacterium sp. 852002-50816_SCH5313054-b]
MGDLHSRPPPAPATKFRPPVAVLSLVTRHKLMAVLCAAGRRRLILIYAPSGFGKTTLVEQWRAELSSSGVAVAWLTVDDDDNNVVWFLAHVLEAIRRVHPAVAASLGQVLEERGEEAVRYVLTSLIDEIDEIGTPVTLVIDDWQRVSHSRTTEALRYLIDHGSHHLQFIVNSWSRARLPLSKLRLRDELVEIDCDNLRFDADEAQALLKDIAGLADSDVAALTASTDGWVAALQLARLSLRGDGDASGLLRRMSGDNEVVGELLAENVLNTLEPELLDFLWATSITERTCGELASVLAGVDGGRDVLEDVERRGLFLRRTDDDPPWFRYHQMFAGFLRRRLERDSPDRLKRLHRTASDWFAEHGYLSYAVDHALAAGEATRAVDLVERDRTIGSVNRSRMTTYLGIIDKLPTQLVNSRPRLNLSIAAANILLQRPAAIEAALDRVAGAISKSDLPAEKRADLTLEADVLRAVAQMNADRVEGLAHLVARVISRPKTLRPVLPQATATVAAFAGIYRFDFEAAHRALEWAAPYDEGAAAGYHSCWEGIAARHQLDIPRALRSFRKAFEIGAAVGRESQAARHAGALLGELLYEMGGFAEAADLLEESYRLGPEAGAVDYLVAQYAVSARIKAAQGDRDAAGSRLDAGMTVAQRLGLPRLAAAINHERVRLQLPIAPPEAARLQAVRRVFHGSNGIATIAAELDEASGIRLLSRSRTRDDRDRACRRAGALLAGIDPTARPLAALHARLLLAETLTAAGLAKDAGDHIAAVRALCTQYGLPQLLVDAGLG